MGKTVSWLAKPRKMGGKGKLGQILLDSFGEEPCAMVLTCDHSQGSNAGEGRNVDVHVLQVGGEFNNGINPFPKATNALQPVQDHPIAKDEFTLHWVGPAINTKERERGEKEREKS